MTNTFIVSFMVVQLFKLSTKDLNISLSILDLKQNLNFFKSAVLELWTTKERIGLPAYHFFLTKYQEKSIRPKDDLWSFFKANSFFCNVVIKIIPKGSKNINYLKSKGSCAFC